MNQYLKIATFNVNSINARMQQVTDWLHQDKPDIACLQELKTTEDKFPFLDIDSLGYHTIMVGQKSYNGVAILYKKTLQVTLLHDKIPNFDDDQARFLAVTCNNFTIINIYAPNGNPYPSEKFNYKLKWYQALYNYVHHTLLPEQNPFIICGDYNICPDDNDCYDAKKLADDAVMRLEARAYFRQLLHIGLWDAWRYCHPNTVHQYSYWDYQAGAYSKDHGLRIDHFLLSPQAMDMLINCDINTDIRAMQKPSDHTPVLCCLNHG